MTVEDMRVAVTGQYKDSSWAKKVAAMPDNQVMAVYFRMSQAGVFDKKKVAISYGDLEVPRKHASTIFYCLSCLKVFEADNKNETECRFCGSSNISNKPPRERIVKHED